LAIIKGETVIYVPSRWSYQLIYFLCNHINTQFQSITDITAVDWCSDEGSSRLSSLQFFAALGRFEVVYNLLSIKYGSRIRVKVLLDEITPLHSVTSIFRGSG